MNCYISDMPWSIVLRHISKHNTWNACDVYKDGAKENLSLLLSSFRYVEAREAKKNRFKMFFTGFWRIRLTKILLKKKICLLFWRECDGGYLLKWAFALLGCYAALIVTDVSGQPVGPILRVKQSWTELETSGGLNSWRGFKIYPYPGNFQRKIKNTGRGGVRTEIRAGNTQIANTNVYRPWPRVRTGIRKHVAAVLSLQE